MKNRVENLKTDHLKKVANRFLDKKDPFSTEKSKSKR